MVKKIIKILLKYPLKIANSIYVNRFYRKNLGRVYEIDNIIDHLDSILVFSPHVDDETIGLGGTLLKGKNIASKMALVYMTDGRGSTSNLSSHRLIEERKREGCRVKEAYGFEKIYFLDEPDGGLDSTKDKLIEKIVDVLDKEKPTIIFTPFLIDGHRDHVETTRLVIKALEKWDTSFSRIYMYEVNSPILPKLITSLTTMGPSLYNEKGKMYAIFKSQWAMGFDAFRLMDRGKRLLIEENKTYAAEVFVKADVNTAKAMDLALEAEGFNPNDFKQLSSQYNLILSFMKNKKKKKELSDRVYGILKRNDKITNL
ncbi:MAG: PIG-L family deacetylase [Tissierellia bacterium]|nr:PIG-L family deacetylase [Tissierellia bacterium]